MREELEKKKKAKRLQSLAEAAGAGGIKNAVSNDTKKKIGKAVSYVANKFVEGAKASTETVGSMAKDLLKKKKTNEVKKLAEVGKGALKATGNTMIINAAKKDNSGDAQLERQTAKRYEKVGVSPIYSKGKFSRNSKELDKKLGNRLTEDDKVPSTSKKKNRAQY